MKYLRIPTWTHCQQRFAAQSLTYQFCRVAMSTQALTAEQIGLFRQDLKLTAEQITDAWGVFSIFDTYGNGRTSPDKLEVMMQCSGKNMSKDDLEATFRQCDGVNFQDVLSLLNDCENEDEEEQDENKEEEEEDSDEDQNQDRKRKKQRRTKVRRTTVTTAGHSTASSSNSTAAPSLGDLYYEYAQGPLPECFVANNKATLINGNCACSGLAGLLKSPSNCLNKPQDC